MRHVNLSLVLMFCLVLTVAVWAPIGNCQTGSTQTAGAATDVASPAESRLPQAALNANIYLQTSGEYRACCYGIYASAGLRLGQLIEGGQPSPLRPAIVMDLDETVLNNASFQTFLYKNGLAYTSELWSQFERAGVSEVGLVPGAGDFIKKAESMGVSVVYLSNRNERNRKWTVAALAGAGVDTTGLSGRLYLRPEGGPSDKTARRDEVMARYNVLMLFGDNLRDFSQVFAAPEMAAGATAEDYLAAIEARAAAVDRADCHWGMDWFVLPNPIYGEWEELIGPVPAAVLTPSAMKTGD